MSTKEKPSSLIYCWQFKAQRQNASLEVWGSVPVGGLCLSKPSLCTARLWGNMVRLARTCSGVFLVIFANCRKTEGYLTGHKVCWANAFNQRKEFEVMLCCMPVVSMNGCWVPQDQLCFSVTRWPCAGKGYRVALGVCPSIMFSLVFFLQYKTGLFFWLDFDAEKVNPIISEPLGGYNTYVVHDVSQEHDMPSLALVASVESRAVLSLSAVSGVGTA